MGMQPVSTVPESSPDGGLVVTGTIKPPNGFFNFRVPMKIIPFNIYVICNTFLNQSTQVFKIQVVIVLII